jgi:D-alanyl-D-alanine carboxypeptidase/D-alanyl-D-alanine-endopeptidase (penicillin-binding protein 4)
MKKFKSPLTIRLLSLFVLALVTLFFQTAVLSQGTTNKDETRPTVATPNGLRTDDFPTIVRPTSSTKAIPPPDIPKTNIQITQEPKVGGRLGLIIESENGSTKLRDVGSTEFFNPASNVKLLTALAAIKTFGIDYRFSISVWTNGTYDASTQTINGDLIISGSDPVFNYEQAVLLAQDLNKLGVRTVTGNLIVPYGFTMNYDSSALRSGETLYDTLDSSRRSSAASRAWYEQRSTIGDVASLQNNPSVAVMGAVVVSYVPENSRVILTRYSPKLVDILKTMLCFSNNFMSERIGFTVGGPGGVKRILVEKYSISESEISLASTSGLGVNRVTPRAMMQAYRILRNELAQRRYTMADIMPVAGIDPGTLEKRFTSQATRGSVIGKTGTLGNTDGGVSSLVGEMKTAKNEIFFFVIFNQRGSVRRFRTFQEDFIAYIQNERGGPAPFIYVPQPWATRLSDTKTIATNKLNQSPTE